MPFSRENSMNKLPKEKRNQLILVVLIIGAAIAGLWYGLINFQQQYLQDLAKRKNAAQDKLKKVELAIKNADQTEAELPTASKKLGFGLIGIFDGQFDLF